MSDIKAVLRYFPVGSVAGPPVEISHDRLKDIAVKNNVSISLHEIKGKNAQVDGDNIHEETMNVAIEDISQSVITVDSNNEASVRGAVKDIIAAYRSPRTVFGIWGSDEKGRNIIIDISSQEDGWL